MKCEEIHHFIDTYLDAELDLARQVELEQHLADCLSCRSLLEERRAFRTFFVAAAREYKAPSQFEAKVLAAMRRVSRREKFSLRHQPWMYATAVVVMSVFLALKILFPDVEKDFSRQAVLRHSRSLFYVASSRCRFSEPGGGQALANRETRFCSAARRFSAFWVFPRWRAGGYN